ncbi:MAG: ketoacyl-ACP synthase III [Phycisphaeraceae bacterium]|nr:MAG: ketoacyl-ACP synthase III [Phycisphaeraceae bacterium]
MPGPTTPMGVRIAATAHYLPERILSNADLEKVMDTSDDWIVQRTGVRERHVCADAESVREMSTNVLKDLFRQSGVKPAELDLLILATVGSWMSCPSTACQILGDLAADPEFGPTNAGAFDMTVACSGFVYGMNIAHDLIRGGAYKNIAVIGTEHLTQYVEYSTRGRGTAILFGDGAGGAMLSPTGDTSKGLLAQSMRSDGAKWTDLYIPRHDRDFPEGDDHSILPLGIMRMNGRSVFRFAVGTFSDLIGETLEKAGLTADDVDQFVCHQSNVRILEAARERFGIPPEKMAVNIDRVGNTSAASVPILLGELWRDGTIKEGDRVMLVAFGAGLTWSSSLWQL